MHHDKILVPYDGTESAKNAVKYAVRILEDAPEAKIILFTSLAGARDVERLMGTGLQGTGFIDPNTRDYYEKLRTKTYNKAIEKMKDAIKELAPEVEANFEYVAEFSPSPVKNILEVADKFGVDSIYMGCRGASAIAGVLGSVSFGVIRSANVPVTVVK